MDHEEINTRVSSIIEEVTKKKFAIDEKLKISSFETLQIVAKLEKEFCIEVEDSTIFRGLFSDIDRVARYVDERKKS